MYLFYLNLVFNIFLNEFFYKVIWLFLLFGFLGFYSLEWVLVGGCYKSWCNRFSEVGY